MTGASLTGASLFTGGGLADLGMMGAGIDMRWGIEHHAETARWCERAFGHPVRAVDIRHADPADFEAVDVLHASPSCPSFSVAKTGGVETENDKELARAMIRFIRALQPRVVTLENVWGYRRSYSWLILWFALREMGYGLGVWHLNSADYGVPQTRRRMIVAAVRDGQDDVSPPPKTHTPTGDLFARRWVGWYEAIEDLVPTCPPSQLASWQRDRLPSELTTFLIMTGNTANGVYASGTMPRAVLVSEQLADKSEPDRSKRKLVMRHGDARSITVDTSGNPKSGNPKRVLLIDGQKSGVGRLSEGQCSLNTADGDSPAFTITAATGTKRPLRAVLVGPNANTTSGAGIYADQGQLAHAVRAPGGGRVLRAVLPGARTVRLTMRCLARFQSVPDSYPLPESRTLAARIIGNGVPCLLMRRLYEHLIRLA